MKKHILLFLLLASCSLLGMQAQNYVVSSLATPGAATFKADKIVDGVINLPFAATTQTIEIETNQQDATVSSDADWCQASFADGTLTLTATENSGEEARTAILSVRSKDFHPLLITVRQEARLVFAVISDTHVGNSYGGRYMEKVSNTLQYLTNQSKLDALAVVGDLTDHGDTDQYEKFVQLFTGTENFAAPVDNFLFMMGNHDNYNSSGKNNYQVGLNSFNIKNGRATSYPFNQLVYIKGYPFITLSVSSGANNDDNSSNGTASYPDETITFLNNSLRRAAKEAPDKPIFIFAHVAPRNTCYSTWGDLEGAAWAMWRLNNSNLRKYPQAVVFCGHSHYPLGDPRSIHQGANPNSKNKNYYTVINTASITYSEINPGAVDAGIHPEGFKDVTEGLILYEQPNGDIEVRRYDTYRGLEIDPEHRWVLKAPFDGSMFQYADIRDKDDNPNNVPLRDGLPAPVFDEGAQLTLDSYSGEVTVTFPQATDNECVFRYKVSVLKNGSEVRSAFVFSQFYLNTDMPKELSYTISGLTANTEYTAEVVAYDSWDNQSSPLTGTFTVPADDAPVPEPLGCWTFDNPDNLLAGTGTATLQGAYHDYDYVEPLGLGELGIVPAAGPTEDNGAVFVPKNNSLLMTTNLEATSLSTYTIMADIKLANFNNFMPIFQNDLTNTHDACLFVNRSNGTIGIMRGGLGYSTTALTAGKWHRVVAVSKNAKLTVYLDGVKVVGESSEADTERWLMSTGTLFFADEDGEELDIETAELRFWNSALTPNQVAQLGAAVPDEGPGEVTIPDALGMWTFDNPDDLLAGTGAATLQATTHQKNNVSVTTPAAANITYVDGPAEGNGAVLVPKNSSLLMTANLGVTSMNTYSILWDAKADNFYPYIPLLQNDLNDSKDGSLFTSKNMVGLNAGGLGYHGTLNNGNWYRILFVVKNNYATVYVNGVKVGASTSAVAQHWQLTTGALFFADEDGEEEAISTAEIRFWDEALTADQAQKLGAAGE